MVRHAVSPRRRRAVVALGGLYLRGADGLPVSASTRAPAASRRPAMGSATSRSAPGEDTVLAKIEQDGGNVLRSAFLHGTLAVPVVAFDGTPAGLSADGSTLVLIKPRVAFPRARTTFVVVAAEALRVRASG